MNKEYDSLRGVSKIHSRFSGFTIVELLVVIVVIGILAAITIVSYIGISSRANIASLTSDLDNASKLLKLDQVVNNAYPATLNDANSGKGIQASSNTNYSYIVNNSISPQGFCITATKGTTTYKITNDSAPTQGDCSTYGLVLSLDASNSLSYPGAGNNKWYDLSGNNNNGTLNGGVSYSATNGGVMGFDGVSGYVQVNDNSLIDLTQTGGAVSLWLKTGVATSGSINGSLVAKTNGYSNGYWFTKYNNQLRISLYGTSSLEMVGNKAITDNIWHYVVATWTSNTLYIYIDGALDRSQGYLFTFSPASNQLYIARMSSVAEGYFSGLMNDIHIYNYTFSASDILQNFNISKVRYGL